MVLWLINEAAASQNSRNRGGLNNNGEPFSLSRGPIKGSWPPLVVHIAHRPPEGAVCRLLLRRVTDWVTIRRLNVAAAGRKAWHRFHSKRGTQRAAAASFWRTRPKSIASPPDDRLTVAELPPCSGIEEKLSGREDLGCSLSPHVGMCGGRTLYSEPVKELWQFCACLFFFASDSNVNVPTMCKLPLCDVCVLYFYTVWTRRPRNPAPSWCVVWI